jgi:hypothetical protein
MLVQVPASDHRQGRDLVLAGHLLRLSADDPSDLGTVHSVMVPPCSTTVMGCAEEPGWSIHVEGIATGGVGIPHRGRPTFGWAESGTQLTVVDTSGGVLTLAGQYRAGTNTALIEVDVNRRQTRVRVPDNDLPSRRWPDWVARMFFGTRLLADGWLLVHGSAVSVQTADGARAVLMLADAHGGKSTLAHRACVENGAALMSDDLVLLRVLADGVMVVGWPTRVCVPIELLSRSMDRRASDRTIVETVLDGRQRRRLVLSPPEYAGLFNVERAGPTRLGGVVLVGKSETANPGPSASAWVVPAPGTALTHAAEAPAQRLMMLDILGVAAVPASHTIPANVASAELLAGLAEVPTVRLDVPDGSALPSIPVWDLLRPHLPWLGAA